MFFNVVGEKFHALTNCASGKLARTNCLDRLPEIVGSENAMTFPWSLPSRSNMQQHMFRKHLGDMTSSVDRAVLLRVQVPDRWMTLVRFAEISLWLING